MSKSAATKDLVQCVGPDYTLVSRETIHQCREHIKTLVKIQKLTKACWVGVRHGSDAQEQKRQEFFASKVYTGRDPSQWSITRRASELSVLHDALNLLRDKPFCHGTGDLHTKAVQEEASRLKILAEKSLMHPGVSN